MATRTYHEEANVGVGSRGVTRGVPENGGSGKGPRLLRIRDASLFVEVVGHGYPLLLMHGGPGADHWTLLPFRRSADQFTLIFYDLRCNGRSVGAPVSSMTWENLTADADALRQKLGLERWAVLGHSFGGQVALEYALHYPDSLSHLVLLDTGGDSHWSQQNAADHPRSDPRRVAHEAAAGGADLRRSPPGQRLDGHGPGEITVPTLVLAGRDDFVFPPEHQLELAAGIPNARLQIIERAGHNPHSEQPAEVIQAVRDFISTAGAGHDGSWAGGPIDPSGWVIGPWPAPASGPRWEGRSGSCRSSG